MEFLDARARSRGNDPFRIGETLEFAPSPPRQGNGPHAPFFSRFQGKDQIGRISTRCKKDKNISSLTEGLHLPGKNLVKSEIVADAGQRSPVRREGNGRQSATVVFVAPDQFLGQMERIGGASPVTGSKDFSASQKNFRDKLCAPIDLGQGCPGISDRLNEFVILLLDDRIHNMKDYLF